MLDLVLDLRNEDQDGKAFSARCHGVEVKVDKFEYIEVFYNRQRRHSAPDCISPYEFEMVNVSP